MTTVRDDRPQQRFVLEKDGAVGELAYEVDGGSSCTPKLPMLCAVRV